MNASDIVKRLLEDDGPASPYDLDSNMLDRPECPVGIVATIPEHPGERIEWRWDDRFGVYFMSKFWNDDYTGKPREGKNLGSVRTDRYNAQKFLQRQTAKLEADGWTVKPL